MKMIDFDLMFVFQCVYRCASACLFIFIIFAYPYENEFVRILIVCAYVTSYVYLRCFLNTDYYYWKKRRIPGPKPNLFFRDEDYKSDHIFISNNTKHIYNAYPDEPVVGIFCQCRPTLVVRDSSIIQDVLVKNFRKFANRGLKKDRDPLEEDLFLVDYPTWKLLRRKLSPVFTSAKLKQMFDVMSKCTDNFIECLNNSVKKSQPVDLCKLAGSFSTDIRALCLFNMDANTLLDEESEFQEIVPDFSIETESDKKLTRMEIMKLIFHRNVEEMKKVFESDDEDEFDLKVIRNNMEDRRRNGIKKNDFLDFLINLKDHPEQLERKKVSDDLLLAQALLFFYSGLDSTSLAIFRALYELALNPCIQNKLRKEIVEAIDKNGGKLDYNVINSAKYLEKIVKETFRKYPSVSQLFRQSDQEHTFPNTHITVSKRIHVIIPVYAIHHDPKIYPDPEKFDPERFDERVANSRPKMSYLPFGDGPRSCIAQRFVQIQIKLCLAVAVTNFRFSVCERTSKVSKEAAFQHLLNLDDRFYLKIRKLWEKKKRNE